MAAALRRVGLEGGAGDPARKLSGGERQRLALARAWLTRPEVLLLDEPTASLDPGATGAMERLVFDMAGAGAEMVLVSHDLGQIARWAEDVLVLSAYDSDGPEPIRDHRLGTSRIAAARPA